MTAKITITIRSIAGEEAQTTIDAQAWAYLSPVRRVLFLHERLRKVTQGRTFEVISQIKGN